MQPSAGIDGAASGVRPGALNRELGCTRKILAGWKRSVKKERRCTLEEPVRRGFVRWRGCGSEGDPSRVYRVSHKGEGKEDEGARS